MMKKKIIFVFLILALMVSYLGFALAGEKGEKCDDKECRAGEKCEEIGNKKKCVRALEIVYPDIPGVPKPQTVMSGLPEYVKYIFNFAVAIIGIVIFGALVYNGFLYLISTGDPNKINEAKSGITSAFLGAAILLASVIIFNKINPQLVAMKIPEVSVLEARVEPGVYICNYKVKDEEIRKFLKNYLTKEGEDQVEAAKQLQKIMWNPEKEQFCPRVNFSGNFRNFPNGVGKDNTIFIIPSIEKDITTGKKTFKWEYGIILHEEENQRGKIAFVPKGKGISDGEKVFFVTSENAEEDPMSQTEYSHGWGDFVARSVTLFRKPSEDNSPKEVTLYGDFHYNLDVEEKEKKEKKFVLDLGKDIKAIGADDLGKPKQGQPEDPNKVYENTASIKFTKGRGSFFVILFDNDNYVSGNGKIIDKDDPDILDIPIAKCPDKCKAPLIGWLFRTFDKESCRPCVRSMLIIRGEIL